jgi:hypothetical protein
MTVAENVLATPDNRPLKYFWGRFWNVTQLFFWQQLLTVPTDTSGDVSNASLYHFFGNI